jgi:hypothetical protein
MALGAQRTGVDHPVDRGLVHIPPHRKLGNAIRLAPRVAADWKGGQGC